MSVAYMKPTQEEWIICSKLRTEILCSEMRLSVYYYYLQQTESGFALNQYHYVQQTERDHLQ